MDKYVEVLQKIKELSNATRIYETYPEWIEQVMTVLVWVTVVLLMGFLVLGMEVEIDSDGPEKKSLKRVFAALLVSGGLFLFSMSMYNKADKGYRTLTDDLSDRVTQVVSDMSEKEHYELQQLMQMNYGSDTGDVTLNVIAKYLNDKLSR